MKEDKWILQIKELNTQDAEASFVSYFQPKKNNVSFLFFFRKGKKAKKSCVFLPSYVISFIHVFSLFKKKLLPFAYMPGFQCHMSKSYSQLLILSPIQYTRKKAITLSTGYVNCFKKIISILRPFTPNPSLKIWQHNIIFWCLAIKSFWFHIVMKSATWRKYVRVLICLSESIFHSCKVLVK